MKIRIQENDFGNIAMLPDGRVEVLNAQGLELVNSINDGKVEYSSKENKICLLCSNMNIYFV